MTSIVAIGSREFVSQLELGGTLGRLASPSTVANILGETLADKSIGLILLQAPLVKELSEELYVRAFYSRKPEVVALGGKWNEVLRNRVREVIGSDLLAPKGKT